MNDAVSIQEDVSIPLNNWNPCEEMLKSITVTNREGVDKYARIKIEEEWKTSDESNMGAVAAIYTAYSTGLSNAFAFSIWSRISWSRTTPSSVAKQSKVFTSGDGTRTNPYKVE